MSSPRKLFGLLDASIVNVIVLKFSNKNIHLDSCVYKATERSTVAYGALDNSLTLLLANKHIPSASIQIDILTMVKMESHMDMPKLRRIP